MISAMFGEQKGHQARPTILCHQERVRTDDLIEIGKREAIIQPQKVMQVGCAAAPMAEHEQRRRNGDLPQHRSVSTFFQPPKGRIHESGKRNRSCPHEVLRIDREPVLAQQLEPVSNRDSSQNAGTTADQESFAP